jgi:site-specific DNA recombinase
MDNNLKKNLQARNVLRVAIYIRVSTQEQAKEGYSIGEQEKRLRAYCDAMQWDIHKVYIDPGYSGGDTNRPGLQDLIKDVKTGAIDKVVVYKLDRLSRSQKDTLILIEDVFLTNNVDFVSMSESFDTSTPVGRAVLGLLAVFAQLERDQIKERMGMGKEARAKEGKWNGGSSEPIGYDYDPNTELLYVNEYEKMQILEAVELFLKGTPLRTISNIFHNKGYTYVGKSGRTSEWDPQRLKYVFRNKTYLGYMRYRGEWYKADHEPILDQDTFDKLQKLLASRAERYAKHTKRSAGQTTYLGGMLYCKQCHGRFAIQTGSTRKPGARNYYYACYSRSKKVPKMVKDPNCQNKNWKMEELDNIVFDEIRKLAKDPNHITDMRAKKLSKTDNLTKVDIIRREIANIDDQISRFMDLYGIGKFSIDQVSGKVDPLNEQRLGLERELQQLNAEAGAITEEEALEVIQSFGEILDRNNFDEIRLALETLIYYIELDEDDVYIHWKFL